MFGLFGPKALFLLFTFPGFGDRVIKVRHTPSKELLARLKATGVGQVRIDGRVVDVYLDIQTPTRIWIQSEESRLGRKLEGDALFRAVESVSTFSNPVPLELLLGIGEPQEF